MKFCIVYILFFFYYLYPTDCMPEYLREASQNRRLEDDRGDRNMHPMIDNFKKNSKEKNTDENFFDHETETNHWYENAYKSLDKKLKNAINKNIAKNVIYFMGDGMSLPTIFATRIYQEQLVKEISNNDELFWESFPFTGLIKTWCIDKQVPDSACTSTSYMTGVKSKFGTIGLNGQVIRGNCTTQNNQANHVDSYFKWAQDKGKATGIVTTTRVTHASPAGGYAHAADRSWECDADVLESGYESSECMDIAFQLITQDPGRNFKVILGGGRREFLPNTTIDEEGHKGRRLDKKNLIESWKLDKESRGSKYLYSWNRTTLFEVINRPSDFDYLLGLYDSTHLPYHLEQDGQKDPTLAEMTEAAIKVLNNSKTGFILFVEGGRIDHAHHNTYATLALDETIELAKAVEVATKLTSAEDTLIIVTADHAHTMSVSGYASRGTRINGPNTNFGDDDLMYMTLSYANGPGFKKPDATGNRHNISSDDTNDVRYRFPSMVPLSSETHSGEDVAIYANGPWAHLFSGTFEQNDIAHYLAYASCIVKKSACLDKSSPVTDAPGLGVSNNMYSIKLTFLSTIYVILFLYI